MCIITDLNFNIVAEFNKIEKKQYITKNNIEKKLWDILKIV